MKRAKDKYMINRTKYKDIKRYDHQQMEDFLTDVYKNGYPYCPWCGQKLKEAEDEQTE